MTTQEEIRQRRIARLLDELETATANLAAAAYQDGLDSGRHGTVSAGVRKGHERAEVKARSLLQELR